MPEKIEMKTYEVYVKTNRQGSKVTETFEMPIDATEEEIEKMAISVMKELYEWSWYPLDGE